MKPSSTQPDADPDAMRVDKWLWAARFFKTRQLAIDAINAGRVTVNGQRVKPAKVLHAGDELVVRKPPYEQIVQVKGVQPRRSSAAIAQTLYTESAASVAARERLAVELKAMPPPLFRGRPTKRDRRQLERMALPIESVDET
jgi:ribosome-associated heat shock protein Hsp15